MGREEKLALGIGWAKSESMWGGGLKLALQIGWAEVFFIFYFFFFWGGGGEASFRNKLG